ncbi:MAG: DNA methylase [Tychonema bourrellyi B0820]|uniref:site-specific DNA-methyltransferase (cytosine-N(4)-specific) n=1 Tax=Tychonema bourrellyi FEM_GT703 TaxID=2040638 RepID=A0A2G4EYB3_9CYAN|nr:DNA methyltransferase [Tychonema bourrellyi]MDQ2100078.1 DNA methylase [Tychonema bourrellyi B0820]PHX54468.1 DNA methylase [Tychonema bourrellyi FEM_GT703]
MQLSLFTDPIHPSLAPTNLTSSRHPIHRWANFIAGYSPEFVSECIREAYLSPGDTVLDPFGGLGTTPVQSLLDGFSCIACEANPYFAHIAIAKCQAALGNVDPDEVFSTLEQLVSYEGDLAEIYSVDALKFLHKLIPEAQLRVLVSAKMRELEIISENRLFYRLIVSMILELTSKSQTDGIYKAPTTKKKSSSFQEALLRVKSQVMEDFYSTAKKSNINYDFIKGTAHLLSEKPSSVASLCVTSPPYLNNFDYAEMSRMELYFWGYAESWREITNKVRSVLIPNTTTIPTEIKKNHELYARQLSSEFIQHLRPLVDELKIRRTQRAGKKDYYSLIYPYFAEIKKVFAECFRLLKSNTDIHVVIGDAYLYGVHIPTGQLTLSLLKEIGFDRMEIKLLRTRGSRWILSKREGAGTPIGEYLISGKKP